MTESTPGPQPGSPPPRPQPASPNQPAAPTPASISGDVPVETWRRRLEEIDEAPSSERHELLSALLDDLDSQVSSL